MQNQNNMLIRKILLSIFLFSIGCTHIPIQEGGEDAVIVIHGFARRARSMNKIAKKIHQSGYEVRNVDYDSIHQSIDEIKEEVFTKFDQYIADSQSREIHFIGHSLGGLLVRAYLDQTTVKNLGSVVLMGAPNKGSQLVNQYEDKWYFSWLGPAVFELKVGGSQFLKELKAPYYKVGVIAGSKPYSKFSAGMLEGDHDGLVTVESTKLKGMHDFIVIDVNHSRMKRDPRVIEQVIYFLKHGQFKK